MGNSELVQFLDGMNELGKKEVRLGYYWWKVDTNEVISVINAVIREFE